MRFCGSRTRSTFAPDPFWRTSPTWECSSADSARTKAALIDKLSDAYDGLTDFELNFEGGTVQIFFTEGELAVPASRVSDGSLRPWLDKYRLGELWTRGHLGGVRW